MVTITDIANALGVTPSTVSRALSGSPRVKEATRQAVLEKAEELGYEPNILASNLRRGRSDFVGMIVPRIHREFFSRLIGGAELVLNAAGYNVLICQTNERKDAELRALHTLRKNQVAGVLMSHSFETDDPLMIADALGSRIPLVQFDRVFRSLPGAKVVNDNFESAYAATRHLAANGYRRIAHFAGYETCELFIDRFRGYCKALEDCGLPYDETLVFKDTIVRETGRDAALLALDRGCDAIYSAGAFSALGALDAFRERGLRVPCDIGIVGTSNETFTGVMTPALTTLDQHAFEMGQAAAKAFLFGSQATTVISMELHIRESSNRNKICQK